MRLVVAAFILLGVTYSVVNPIFEAPDETFHFAYIQHLAGGRGLPVQDPENTGLWRQEGSQPPLYYMLGALLTFWIDTSDAPTYMRLNPHAAGGHPEADGNRNIVLHTPAESFPYRGTVLAIHLLRLFSLILGTTTVIFVYRVAWEVFPERRLLPLTAAAIMAFNPQFLFISSAVNNDNLVTALSAVTAYLALRVTQPGTSRYEIIGLGISLGMALLSKLSGLTLLVLVACAIGLGAGRRRSWQYLLTTGFTVFGVAILIAGWWYWRNWRLYGDPTGLNAMLLVATPRSLSGRELLSELQGIVLSFWAVFGWFNILADSAVYWLVQIILALGVAGLVIYGSVRKPKSEIRNPKSHLGLLALWLAVVVAGLLRWTSLTMGSQGRLLFPAAPAIGLFIALGLLELVPGRYQKVMAIAVGGSLLGVAAIAPFRYIAPAYARPLVLPGIDTAAIPHPVHITYGDYACSESCPAVELLGYDLDDKGAQPGGSFHITLYWRALRPLDQAYSVYVHLRTPEGEIVSQRDSYPGRGSYPTFLWEPGDIILDPYRLDIPRDARAPGIGRIEVGLYTFENLHKLPAYDRQGKAIVPVIGRFKVRSPEALEIAVTNALGVIFGNEVVLAGWEADSLTVRAGETLHFTLIWKALASMDVDYTAFVHLVEAPDRPPLAQADGEPRDGRYPTSLWDAGEMVRDVRSLPIPSDLPAGEYHLIVGLYRLETGERLPVSGGRDSSAGPSIPRDKLGADFVALTPVLVVGSQSDV